MAIDFDMFSSQRCEPIRMVLFGVFFVAYADAGCLEQPHYGGEHIAARQSRKREVSFHLLSNSGKRFAKGSHTNELRGVVHGAVERMIAVLLAAFCVAADSLQMSIL
jgi:hypothetical protein